MNIETFICQAQIWISIKAFALETRSALITVPRHLYEQSALLKLESRNGRITRVPILNRSDSSMAINLLNPGQISGGSYPTSSLDGAIIPRCNLNRNGVARLPLSTRTIRYL